MSALANYRSARRTYEAALAALAAEAAAYVDQHPELDTTGEWARIRSIFPTAYLDHWEVNVDYEDRIVFRKTTQRGFVEHEIHVKLSDLVQLPVHLLMICNDCNESFVPEDENDVIHCVREDGEMCGGQGRWA